MRVQLHRLLRKEVIDLTSRTWTSLILAVVVGLLIEGITILILVGTFGPSGGFLVFLPGVAALLIGPLIAGLGSGRRLTAAVAFAILSLTYAVIWLAFTAPAKSYRCADGRAAASAQECRSSR